MSWFMLALEVTFILGVGALVIKMLYKTYKDTCENERVAEDNKRGKDERS